MRSPLSKRLNLVATLVVLFAAQNCLAQDSAPRDSEERLREEFVDAVVKNSDLHGVWVNLRRIPTNERGNEFVLEAVLDSQPGIENSQRNELARMIRQYPKSFLLEDEIRVIGRLPFRQLISELKTDIEFSNDMKGAAIEDAYYFDEASEDVSVVLVGRVMDEGQRETMTRMCNAKIGKLFPDGVPGGFMSTKTKTRQYVEGVVHVNPSAEIASFSFDLGVQRYAARNYEDAYVSFTRAHVEAPGRLDIQYWRVVCLLAGGRDADAKRLLQSIVESRPQNAKTAKDLIRVCRSLESVQGPTRWRLIDMENALLYKTKAAN